MSASSAPAVAAAGQPSRVQHRRLGLLRAGLIIAAVFALLGVLPSLDMGFDGSAWDVVLIVFAVLSVVVLLGSIACLILGWNGRRAAAISACVLQVISLIPSLPAFFLPHHETTAEGPGPLIAVVGIVLTAVVIAIILFGLHRANRVSAVTELV